VGFDVGPGLWLHRVASRIGFAAVLFDPPRLAGSGFEQVSRLEHGCGEQPTAEVPVCAEGRGLFYQEEEHVLCDVLGQVPVAHVPEGDGIHEAGVPSHEVGERVGRVSAQVSA
jgi:hypothetical protein